MNKAASSATVRHATHWTTTLRTQTQQQQQIEAMNDNSRLISELQQNYGNTCYWIGEIDGDIYMIYLLMFHCAVLVNPAPIGGADHRYCYHNPDIALKAILEVTQHGRLRHWKKDHTNNISVGCGNKLFKAGVPHEPECAHDTVDWDITGYDEKYPYSPAALI